MSRSTHESNPGGRLARRLALLVGAALLIAGCGSTKPSTERSPEAIAVAFVEARNAWDSEALSRLLAPDAKIVDLEVTSRGATYEELLSWYEVLDWNWLVDACTSSETNGRAEVECSYSYENAWTRELGIGPFTDNMFQFVIENGVIEEVENRFSIVGFSGPAWSRFQSWVGANHPDDLMEMYDGSLARFTLESITLWGQHTGEFVAEIEAGSAGDS